jgi:hypothetical protein
MTRAKLFVAGLVVLVVAVGIGFAWGASGRRAAEEARDAALQRVDMAEARGKILEARVSLYNVNFGDAQRLLEEAKAPLGRVRDRYQQDGNDQAAQAIATGLTHVANAQQLAGKLDASANTEANAALVAIQGAH